MRRTDGGQFVKPTFDLADRLAGRPALQFRGIFVGAGITLAGRLLLFSYYAFGVVFQKEVAEKSASNPSRVPGPSFKNFNHQ